MKKPRFSRAYAIMVFTIFTSCASVEAQLPELPQKEMQELAEKLLDYAQDSPKNTVLLKQANEELNLTQAKPESPDMTLLTSTDRTVTMYGHQAYRALLENPISNIEKILQRQNVVRHFKENPELLAEFDEILSYIARHQHSIFMLWSLSNPFQNRSIDLLGLLTHLTGTKNSKHGVEAMRQALLFSTGLITGGLAFMTGLAVTQVLLDGIRVNRDIPTAIGIVFSGLWFWKAIPAVLHQENISMQMQELMISVGTTLRAARALNAALEKVPYADAVFIYADNLRKYTQETTLLSQDLQELMEELKASTFKGKPSFFSHMGRVRTAYELTAKLKNSLIPLLKAIGEVDAYVSPAKLLLEYQAQPVHYSFTQFLDGLEEPVFAVEKSWNPVIKTNSIITEDLALGNGDGLVPNILLTGPHGGGKSTLMRQLAYCVVLSQIFGIAPCDSCRMTVFSSINTYLDIKDNMEEGKSTFMAERERIDYLKRIIRGLSEGRFGFTIVDELFKGTMEEEASKLVTAFMEKVEQVTESICIMSSHFIKPAIAAEEREGSRFANFHMHTQERTPGRFKRFFKLMKGRCDWWFTDHDKRGRYVKWLQSVVV